MWTVCGDGTDEKWIKTLEVFLSILVSERLSIKSFFKCLSFRIIFGFLFCYAYNTAQSLLWKRTNIRCRPICNVLYTNELNITRVRTARVHVLAFCDFNHRTRYTVIITCKTFKAYMNILSRRRFDVELLRYVCVNVSFIRYRLVFLLI